jgi:PAS domain S-box-containing protein
VLSRATLIRDDNGTPIRMVGTNTDISRRKRAEQALADSEERFSLAMLGSSDGLYDWDLETGNFYYSPRWYEMLGYSGDELEGTTQPWEQLIHPDDLPRITKFQNDWMKSDAKSTEIEVRLRHKDGHYVDILSRSILVRDSDGTPTRMVGTNTDISARKRAEKALLESEEKFRAMTENTTDFIVIFDFEGLHKYVSPSVIRATGMDAEDLIGQPVYDFIHSEDKQKFSQTLKQAQKHPGETFYLPELRLVFQDRLVYLETLFTALPNVPGVDGVVSNARDISAKKKAEYDLVIAKEQAETANKAKSQFLSSMSHELRTPMNAILGYTQLLEQNAAGPLNKDQKTFVEEIMRSGHHMLELIGDVLDLTKIESGNISLEIEDQEPWPLIDTCLKMVSGLAAQRGISIENQIPFDDLPMVSVDGLRFKQAFLNVLSNAVKYNRPDGEVTLKCAKTDSGNFCVSVSDTGPGITQEMHDKVFEPFDRLGAESSDIAGTGIGLSVSKQLVEGMGGRIGFESALGEGSTFWIEVPLAG